MARSLMIFVLVSTLPLLAQQNFTSNGQHPSPEQLMQQFDCNGDGKISRDEAPERMKQNWDNIDTAHKGYITLEDLKARDTRVGNGGGREGRNGPAARQQSTESQAGNVPGVVAGTRAYVNAANSAGKHDGKSWATAFASLQDALTANAAEIWVAKGSYQPGKDHNATFQLHKGGAIYGGFAGYETVREQRDWQRNATILDGNSATHVVTGADDAILDGFTVTGGNAMSGGGSGPPGGGMMQRGGGGFPGGVPPDGSPGGGTGGSLAIHMTPQGIMGGSNSGSGAGMLNFHASPTVRNCVFENNQAGKGGAVYNMTSTTFPPRPDANNKSPTFINCVFRKNTARGRGGGVSNDLGTAPLFLNCIFDSNETPQKGGGMYNDFGCSPTLINCLFTGNRAQSAGGMGNDGGSSPVLFFCTFTKNYAVDYGAPLYQGTGPASNPALINCLVNDNTCDWEDPGIYNWHDCIPVIKDSSPGDSGYKPGRFTETQLKRLLRDVAPFKAKPAREPEEIATENIPAAQRIVYADTGAGTHGDGHTWATAYASLTAAIADAGKDGAEIRLAAGTYRGGTDRAAAFVLRPGVRIYGGYKNGRRNVAQNTTVLDGNHAYHVVIGANHAVLDGLTITGGYADGSGYNGKGGGLIAYRNAPQGRPNSEVVNGFTMMINQCVFSNNYARDGGAVYSFDRGKSAFTACVFADNRAENGGAVLDRVGVESTYENCYFTDNVAHWRGGAVYFDYGARPKLTSCVFRHNTTEGHGGAAFSVSRASQLENTIVTLTSCTFADNLAKGDGGAAAFCDSSMSAVQNCTFTGNKAGRQGNDVFNDPSSSSAAEGANNNPIRPTGMKGSSPQGYSSNESGNPSGARRGGENLPTHFQPGGDFSVVIIGSGGPPYDPKRSGPSAVIQYRGRFILVDMGNGTQARLYEAGISTSLMDAFLVTHHHRDHDEEFMPLLNGALVRGLPLEIIGPPGTKKLADFTVEFYAEDIKYRIERMGRSAQHIHKPNVREIQGGENFQLGELQVKTVQVPHSIHTVAYRFNAGGKSIVISGDLTYSEKLIELARKADVLVIDSGAAIVRPNASHAAGGGGGGAAQQNSAHASAADVANMAQKAGVKKLVLTHIVANEMDEDATIKLLGEIYKGQVVMGRDLLEIVPEKP